MGEVDDVDGLGLREPGCPPPPPARPRRPRSPPGGMKRKLEIVRSLMHRPQVLFLDEPTAGLDAASRRALWKYLREGRERSGTTVFLTPHYAEEAEDCD